MRLFFITILCLLCGTLSAQVEKSNHSNLPQNDSTKWYNIHFQTTYVYQYKPSFHAPYSSINSLTNKEEHQNSLTATLYMGFRLWKGAELYINPEIAGGSGLSGALGMAGSSNGETFRVGEKEPTLYLSRAFIMQTFALGHEQTYQSDDANELSGYQPKNYIRLYLGKYSLGDYFDNNDFSNSPRTQFLNWGLMNNGAWDYAANVRGYTYSFMAEAQIKQMAYRIALATLPTYANGPDLNTDLSEAYSLNAEAERSFGSANKKGHIRLLAYYNNANMGNYNQSISEAHTDTPNIINSRRYGRTKFGLGLNFDQQLNETFGVFARLGWNDGKNETWCFTEIDNTLAAGLSINGDKWHRSEDNGGIAIDVNGLSADHKNYLAAGGYGFMLGDGKLNYANEMIAELYYNFKPSALPIWLTGDYQFVANPGYNKDRGPVSIFSLRVHVEL